MSANTPCFLTVIGENLIIIFIKQLLQLSLIMIIVLRENEDVDTTLKIAVEKSVSSKTLAILIINGHSNNSQKWG